MNDLLLWLCVYVESLLEDYNRLCFHARVASVLTIVCPGHNRLLQQLCQCFFANQVLLPDYNRQFKGILQNSSYYYRMIRIYSYSMTDIYFPYCYVFIELIYFNKNFISKPSKFLYNTMIRVHDILSTINTVCPFHVFFFFSSISLISPLSSSCTRH